MSERKPPSLAFTSFERALLRSADEDEAPQGATARALLALGVGTSHAAVSQSAAGASGAALRTPGAAWSLWQKPLLIGVLGGVGVALSARIIDGPAPRAVPAPLVVAARTGAPLQAAPAPSPNQLASEQRHEETSTRAITGFERVRAASAAASATPPEPELAVPPAPTTALSLPPPVALPNDHPPPPVPASMGGEADPGGASASSSSSIAAEVLVVDRARGALRDGRARDALAELARYREQWPLGVLTPEVTVLQIEAELRLGSRDSARRRARHLVAAQPNSRYAARLRTLFDESELR